MAEGSPDRGALKGTEALDLYLTELMRCVLLMGKQSTLLLQVSSERLDLLTRLAEQAEAPEKL